jgi:Arc/MetJ-type ribon-helix-helix transcriptional regulator
MKEKAGKKDFLYFLNRNYYVASHLVERLDELKDLPLFSTHSDAVKTAIKLLEANLDQNESIFTSLGEDNSFEECLPMIGFLENTFSIILDLNNKTPYLSLLDYVFIADALLKENSRMAELSLLHLPKFNNQQYLINKINPLESLIVLLEEAFSIA